ncbi:MAG: shikimate dehydrogenase [Acidimicrobiales bacterium]
MNPERSSPQWPSGRSLVVGVVGTPIRHSLSPLLHNAAFDAMGIDWVSVAWEVAAADIERALGGMRALGIAGLSVTMPHKHSAARLVDVLSPVARVLEAVNCITWRDGKLWGDSTDGAGFVDALAHGAGFDPAGRRCLVLGAGGAARAVVHALAASGAAEVSVLNRDQGRAESAAALAGRAGRVAQGSDVSHADLVVQATPVGMQDEVQLHPLLDTGLLRAGQLAVDLVYLPERTPFLASAHAAGAQVLGGLGMLVHQASRALALWTGSSPPVQAMWDAARRHLEADPAS